MEHQLISHELDKPLKLSIHLDQVIKAARYLISKKNLNFKGISEKQIEEICILMASCHDFGKSTSFFQEYIKSIKGDKKYKGSALEKSHSLISAFFGYYVTEKWVSKNFLEDHWNSFLPFAVFLAIEGHHGSYKSIEETIKIIDGNFELLEEQLNKIDPEIFQYKFDNVNFGDYSNFDITEIEEIASKIDKIFMSYKKVPKGYNEDTWLDIQIEHRLLALLLYSILLEADKAYLASDDPEQYKHEPISIPEDIVDKYIHKLEKSKLIDDERNKAYKETIHNVNSFPLTERLHSITLPTGMGKTLLSASWAIKLRSRIENEYKFNPKIIVSLPFLSIIEQTDRTYKDVLKEIYAQHEESLYMASYSIADFKYRDGIDDTERSDNSVDFFLNTWNAEIIVSTFDQLLYSIFSLRSKHLMRFHNLFNSIIIFDEVQALPSELWKLFEKFFKILSKIGNTHILLMSATQPGFLPGSIERVPNHEIYFENRRRVELDVSPERRQLDTFLGELPELLATHADKSMMIVLNTRETSKLVLKTIKSICENGRNARPIFYLSSLVAPSQRSDRISEMKESLEGNEKPLIVTTQCIEAGVDLDVDYIVRDWAPIDSIFQVCGRCNRNGKKEKGYVKIIRLESDKGKAFSEMIYDGIALESTARSLDGLGLKVHETQFYGLGAKYFELVRERLGQSMKITNAYAHYTHKYTNSGKEIIVDIKKLLRGDDYQQQFIIRSLDKDLEEKLQNALDVKDRWQRRYAVKRLRKRIAANSISIRFQGWMPVKPDDLTLSRIGNFRILDEQFYNKDDRDGVGLDVDLKKTVGGSIIT